jgi:SAM-dependent methyltransferase
MPTTPLPLSSFMPEKNGASAHLAGADTLEFTAGSDALGQGIVFVSSLLEGLDVAKSFPAIVSMEVTIKNGTAWICLTGDNTLPMLAQRNVKSSNSVDLVQFYIAEIRNGLHLYVGTAEGRPEGRVSHLSIAPASGLDRATIKRLGAANFPHWFYDADLGDGVRIAATTPAASMAGHRQGYGVLQFMLEKVVKSVEGKTGIDVACNAGFHTFGLARRGALMTGVDVDDGAVGQARFIYECDPGAYPNPIRFETRSVYDLRPEDGIYDFVYCSGLMYHLTDPIIAMKRIYDVCSLGAVIQSSCTPLGGDVFELSDPEKFDFCAPWEFALVPSASVLRKICEHAGFKVIAMTHLNEFDDDFRYLPQDNPYDNNTGPVYLALEK